MNTLSSPTSVVIVGAGHAGGRLALQLRDQGFAGAIHLVGDEAYPPYERPPLSKGVLLGEPFQAWITNDDVLAERGIVRHPGRAISVDGESRRLTLDTGAVLGFDHLVMAHGGRARPLAIPGANLPGVQVLRNLDDALALKPRLVDGHRLVVIGGGFIGLEAAASARSLGCAVTVIEGAPRLLGRAVPADLAAQVQAVHEAKGVQVRCGVLPTAITATASGLRVHLSEVDALDCDTVLVGIGIAPNIELAQSLGLACDNGVVVDAQLRTAQPQVLAIGDLARFPLRGELVRLESWQNAEETARVAAATILGQEATVDFVPWFWSDQFDHQLQIAGQPSLGTQVAERPLGGGASLKGYYAGDQLVGVAAWGPTSAVAKEFKLARMLLDRGAHPAVTDFVNPSIKLKSLL